MNELCRLIWCGLIGFFRSRTSLEAEILVLRHQLNVLRRKSPKRPTFGNIDRLIFAGLYGLAPNVRSALARLRAMGIRDRPIAPRSPWQNGYCERLIGSIRRECLDHIVVFGERHLRHLLCAYANYYNRTRTHLSLNKDSPAPRAIESFGRILPVPILGGLHHRYVRI
jgi:hypothetical protein